MKTIKFALGLLSVLIILAAYGVGVVSADTDLTLSDTVPLNSDSSVGVDYVDGDAAVGVLDDFNRADGPLGVNWTVTQGTFRVYNNAAQGGGMHAKAIYNGETGNILQADVQAVGSSLQYTGLILAYEDTDNCLFVKVQQQDGGGQFEHAAFYLGSASWGGTGAGFFDLDSPFSTAHMTVELNGSTVTLTFSNIDGGAETQTYTAYDFPGTAGNSIGICGYNDIARIDNFAGEGCDYCFEDSIGFKWCLNVIDEDPWPYLFLAGNVDMGYETRTAVGTYNGWNCAISFTADEGSGVPFNYNFKFNGPVGQGVWVNVSPSAGHGTVQVNLCGAANDSETEEDGPLPGVLGE